jgi:hypothetical protein
VGFNAYRLPIQWLLRRRSKRWRCRAFSCDGCQAKRENQSLIFATFGCIGGRQRCASRKRSADHGHAAHSERIPRSALNSTLNRSETTPLLALGTRLFNGDWVAPRSRLVPASSKISQPETGPPLHGLTIFYLFCLPPVQQCLPAQTGRIPAAIFFGRRNPALHESFNNGNGSSCRWPTGSLACPKISA